MKRSLAVAALVASVAIVPSLAAQRSAPASFRRAGAEMPQQNRSRSNPTVTGHIGIATGDNSLDIGIFVGASLAWDLKGLPIDIRFDPSIARYGGGNSGADISSILLGFPVAVEYEFKTAGKAKPYVMGGVGMYYNRVTVEVETPGFGVDASGSDTDLGIAFGGGVRLTDRFGIEGRVIDVNSFTTLPILFTIKF